MATTQDADQIREWMDRSATLLYRCGVTLDEALREFEKLYLAQALEDCDWNQCEAARVLGLHRNTLGRKLRLLNIDVKAGRLGRKPARSVVIVRSNVVRVAGVAR